LKFFLA